MQRNALNGRPEPEVIANFMDGLSYSKGKLEDGLRNIVALNNRPPKPSKDAFTGKKEDIDLIMRQFEMPRPQAERALNDAKGDIAAALLALISP